MRKTLVRKMVQVAVVSYRLGDIMGNFKCFIVRSKSADFGVILVVVPHAQS